MLAWTAAQRDCAGTPRPGLKPSNPNDSHHHRYCDDFDELAWDAKRDDQQDRDERRQSRNSENEARTRLRKLRAKGRRMRFADEPEMGAGG